MRRRIPLLCRILACTNFRTFIKPSKAMTVDQQRINASVVVLRVHCVTVFMSFCSVVGLSSYKPASLCIQTHTHRRNDGTMTRVLWRRDRHNGPSSFLQRLGQSCG